MSDDEIFDDVANHVGLPVYSGSDPTVTAYLVKSRRYAANVFALPTNKPNAKKAYINMLLNSELDPFAYALDSGHEGIALTNGCVTVLESFFNHILAHPNTCDLFPKVGDASLEIAPAVRYTLSRTQSGVLPPVPKDNQRATAANMMVQLALDFLTFHEIAHYHLGHNRLHVSPGITSMIRELNFANSLSEDEVITAQTLEMNADAYAVAQGLKKLEDMAASAKAQNNNIDDRAFLEDMLKIWFYACCGLFRLFAIDQPFKIEDIAVHIHPPARVRLMWTVLAVLRHSKDKTFAIDEDAVYRIAENVASQLERDVATITGTAVDVQGIMLATDERVDDHLERLRKRYEELRSDLEAASYSTASVIN